MSGHGTGLARCPEQPPGLGQPGHKRKFPTIPRVSRTILESRTQGLPPWPKENFAAEESMDLGCEESPTQRFMAGGTACGDDCGDAWGINWASGRALVEYPSDDQGDARWGAHLGRSRISTSVSSLDSGMGSPDRDENHHSGLAAASAKGTKRRRRESNVFPVSEEMALLKYVIRMGVCPKGALRETLCKKNSAIKDQGTFDRFVLTFNAAFEEALAAYCAKMGIDSPSLKDYRDFRIRTRLSKSETFKCLYDKLQGEHGKKKKTSTKFDYFVDGKIVKTTTRTPAYAECMCHEIQNVFDEFDIDKFKLNHSKTKDAKKLQEYEDKFDKCKRKFKISYTEEVYVQACASCGIYVNDVDCTRAPASTNNTVDLNSPSTHHLSICNPSVFPVMIGQTSSDNVLPPTDNTDAHDSSVVGPCFSLPLTNAERCYVCVPTDRTHALFDFKPSTGEIFAGVSGKKFVEMFQPLWVDSSTEIVVLHKAIHFAAKTGHQPQRSGDDLSTSDDRLAPGDYIIEVEKLTTLEDIDVDEAISQLWSAESPHDWVHEGGMSSRVCYSEDSTGTGFIGDVFGVVGSQFCNRGTSSSNNSSPDDGCEPSEIESDCSGGSVSRTTTVPPCPTTLIGNFHFVPLGVQHRRVKRCVICVPQPFYAEPHLLTPFQPNTGLCIVLRPLSVPRKMSFFCQPTRALPSPSEMQRCAWAREITGGESFLRLSHDSLSYSYARLLGSPLRQLLMGVCESIRDEPTESDQLTEQARNRESSRSRFKMPAQDHAVVASAVKGSSGMARGPIASLDIDFELPNKDDVGIREVTKEEDHWCWCTATGADGKPRHANGFGKKGAIEKMALRWHCGTNQTHTCIDVENCPTERSEINAATRSDSVVNGLCYECGTAEAPAPVRAIAHFQCCGVDQYGKRCKATSHIDGCIALLPQLVPAKEEQHCAVCGPTDDPYVVRFPCGCEISVSGLERSVKRQLGSVQTQFIVSPISGHYVSICPVQATSQCSASCLHDLQIYKLFGENLYEKVKSLGTRKSNWLLVDRKAAAPNYTRTLSYSDTGNRPHHDTEKPEKHTENEEETSAPMKPKKKLYMDVKKALRHAVCQVCPIPNCNHVGPVTGTRTKVTCNACETSFCNFCSHPTGIVAGYDGLICDKTCPVGLKGACLGNGATLSTEHEAAIQEFCRQRALRLLRTVYDQYPKEFQNLYRSEPKLFRLFDGKESGVARLSVTPADVRGYERSEAMP